MPPRTVLWHRRIMIASLKCKSVSRFSRIFLYSRKRGRRELFREVRVIRRIIVSNIDRDWRTSLSITTNLTPSRSPTTTDAVRPSQTSPKPLAISSNVRNCPFAAAVPAAAMVETCTLGRIRFQGTTIMDVAMQ